MAEKYISDSQLENSRQALLKNKIDLQQVRIDHSSKLIDLSVKQQLILDYTISSTEERERLASNLEESFLNLKARLKIWENNYMLISPVAGTAAFTKYQTVNQTVLKDEPVLSVIPHEQGDFIGRISLRMQRSGKVSLGQFVNIKLSGYPYLEYGMLRGKVISMSLVPSDNMYIIEIGLPAGLTTIYGNKLAFTQNMQGLAEIITEETSLLQKIINPFRHMIAKNKL
jgi:HlyD family secretion protein